jgi:hypothetical protein
MSITRMVSISRDNIIRMSAEPEFYVKNPAFESIKDEMDNCRKAFNDSGRKAGCHCRADTKLLIPCVTAFLSILTQAKENEEQYDVVNNFVKYVAKSDDITGTGISVYFRSLDGSDEMVRYEFYELRKP